MDVERRKGDRAAKKVVELTEGFIADVDRRLTRLERGLYWRYALVLIGLVIAGLWVKHDVNSQRFDTRALCSLRADLQKRVQSGNDYLKTHPRGIPGVPVATLRTSVENSQRSLNALHPLVCPTTGR